MTVFQKILLSACFMLTPMAVFAMEIEKEKPTARVTAFPRSVSAVEPSAQAATPQVRHSRSVEEKRAGMGDDLFWQFFLYLDGDLKENFSKFVTNGKDPRENFSLPILTMRIPGQEGVFWSDLRKKCALVINKNVQKPLESRFLGDDGYGDDDYDQPLTDPLFPIKKFSALDWDSGKKVVPVVATVQNDTPFQKLRTYGVQKFEEMKENPFWKALHVGDPQLVETGELALIVGDVGAGERGQNHYISESRKLCSILNQRLPNANLNNLNFVYQIHFDTIDPRHRPGAPSLQQHWRGELKAFSNPPLDLKGPTEGPGTYK